MTLRTISSVVLSMLVGCSAWAGGTPQGTAFTYQGVLKQGRAPANGMYHLRFQLWDELTGGAQVGADVDAPALAIADGLFTASLDFGSTAFDGSARWLEVQVITNGGATITTLSPRQPVHAAPYALFALRTDGANIPNLNASNLVSGTVPGAQLAGAYANALTLSNALNTFAGTFTGGGAGLTSLNATNIASGTLSAARLPSGGIWPLSSTLNLDSSTLAIDAVNNRVGIGTSTPGTRLHIKGADEGLRIDGPGVAAANSAYISFQDSNGTRIGYVGDGSSGDSSIYLESDTGDVHLYPGGPVLTAKSNGRVGIGTTTPSAPLHVRTTGPFMVLQDMASAANQAGYVSYWNNVGTETAWVGFGTPGSPHFSIVNARAGGNINLSAFSGQVVMGEATISDGLNVGEFLIVTDDGSLALFDRVGSDGTMVDFRKSGVLAGTISVTGTTVTYGAFTGCHYGWSDRAIERGTLVVMTGQNRRRIDDPSDEPVYGVAPSATPNDPRCLGAYLGVLEPAQPPSLDNPHQIMAVGNGDMWVVESDSSAGGAGGGRDIQPGDYLISSDVEGHAMLDDPQRFPIGHVIARAAEAVNWEGATESVAGRRHRRISVFFENFERGSGADAEIAALRAAQRDLRSENDALRDRLEQLEKLVHELAPQAGGSQ